MKEDDAWIALDNKKYNLALQIWHNLIEKERDIIRKNILEMHSCYALIELKEFDTAREILLDLFKQQKDHKYLHQLCMVERVASKFDQALKYLQQEDKLISEEDWCALSANRYEFAKIYELQSNIQLALQFAQECLKYADRCDDVVMKACAFRVLGDVCSYEKTKEALDYYKQSKKLFLHVKDYVAVKELDEQVASLK